MMHGVSPLRQAVDFGGCTKTCAMMRDVSPLRQAGDFGGCTKTCAMMRGASPLLRHRQSKQESAWRLIS